MDLFVFSNKNISPSLALSGIAVKHLNVELCTIFERERECLTLEREQKYIYSEYKFSAGWVGVVVTLFLFDSFSTLEEFCWDSNLYVPDTEHTLPHTEQSSENVAI